VRLFQNFSFWNSLNRNSLQSRVNLYALALAVCCTCGFFAQGAFGTLCKKSRLMGKLWHSALEFARYKYSFYARSATNSWPLPVFSEWLSVFASRSPAFLNKTVVLF
jgi:hypothetical protein